MRGFDVFIIRI